MTKTENKYILRWAKKIKAISLLGGKCEHCGDDDIFTLCFHHSNPDEKDYSINEILDGRWKVIKDEIEKCILLCNNCHRELHSKNVDDTRGKINKKIYLSFKNVFKCEICGYDKDNDSLHLHHRKGTDKKFEVSNVNKRYKTVGDICEHVVEELNKCNVICSNCHQKQHTDINKFEKFKDKIYKKMESYRELRNPLDKNKVIEMYESGIRQKDIVEYFGCAKSTISMIIKNGKVC